jgi:hypothetical protein
MSERPIPGRHYQHFKGNTYSVITIAKHSENLEDMVVYYRLDGDTMTVQYWARPISSWMSPAINSAGETVERFKLLYTAK